MPDAFLESSVVIGLLFRHAGERTACEQAIPVGATRACSRYVQYEVARGFLRSLLALHNISFEYDSYADLHLAAYSGQKRFRSYEMHTWLGAFTDFEAALEAEDEALSQAQKLEEFRAKLRGWIRRGWARLQRDFDLSIDDVGCRDPLQAPRIRDDGRIEQSLELDRCGVVGACKVMAFVNQRRPEMELVADGLAELPPSKSDPETKKRIVALRELAKADPQMSFTGKRCYECGDAFIAIEAPVTHTIVTKNAKHFVPIAGLLVKQVSVAITAKSTRPSSGDS
jgi:hypothetical protein